MSLIPDTAPFSDEQRAWLNGFFSGLLGIEPSMVSSDALAAAGLTAESVIAAKTPDAAEQEEEDFPWHESDLPIVDRMGLAEGRPLKHQLMAAMAQLDCGSCGYLCQTYSEAIALGEESNLTLCSPGGKETKQMIKKLLKDAPGANTNGAKQNVAAEQGTSRTNPFAAKLIESRPLNLEGSAKDTRHVVIDLQDSDIEYHVGDALGVYPTNCDELVGQLIARLNLSAEANVTTPLGNEKSLSSALREDCCLKDPSDELLELLIVHTTDDQAKQTLQTMLDDGVPDGFDILDVLQTTNDVMVDPGELIATLEPLNPRLYSIASSSKQVGKQVHLTIGTVTYEREGRTRKGVASTMFAHRMDPGDCVRVFQQPNHGGFTVPTDGNKPIIMVGPGTGIAPFIAFLQERAATKAPGKNWLFFGDQHEACDFLYEEELKAWQQDGVLTRLDTAFSRDGDQKVYVQDRMREQGAELWQWLLEGGYFYVCGDASRMAADVDRALVDLCAQHGDMTDEQAKAFVAQLTAEKRYVRDVY
ncbi:MAG: sulfite reductase subunit alpha [Pirellulaceae bacterium]|nr:sulfite reductase subunit alpha [Pirellulaceae bacterium]